MAKTKITKFEQPQARLLQFNQHRKAIPLSRESVNSDRRMVASVAPDLDLSRFSEHELSVLAAAFQSAEFQKVYSRTRLLS